MKRQANKAGKRRHKFVPGGKSIRGPPAKAAPPAVTCDAIPAATERDADLEVYKTTKETWYTTHPIKRGKGHGNQDRAFRCLERWGI